MLFPIRLFMAIAFALIGVFFIMAASNNWKWAFKLIMGADGLKKRGETFTRTSFYVIGGVCCLIALLILF